MNYHLINDETLPKWCHSQWVEARKRAKKRGIQFSLTEQGFKRIYNRCYGRCSVTKLDFAFGKYKDAFRRPFTPSVDRIDSKLGYTDKNCRLVLSCVNIAMNEWGEDVFHIIIEAVRRQTEQQRELDIPTPTTKVLIPQEIYSESALCWYFGVPQNEVSVLRRENHIPYTLMRWGKRVSFGYKPRDFISHLTKFKIHYTAGAGYTPNPLGKRWSPQ